MSANFGPGFHAASGRAVDSLAYDQYLGRWSRLFLPMVLAAAEIGPGRSVLDVATGTGEAAKMAVPIVGTSGLVIGADISPVMLECARNRLEGPFFRPVAADGQALPFRDGTFDAVICQLGLQFFANPELGLIEFRRVLRNGGFVAVCVLSTADRAPMWGILSDVLSRLLPEHRKTLRLSFVLSDPRRLQHLLTSAGFHDTRVERHQREDVVESFDDYWKPIEAGVGSLPQAYLALDKANRQEVREEMKARFSRFQSDGHLLMGVEMLIGSGRA